MILVLIPLLLIELTLILHVLHPHQIQLLCCLPPPVHLPPPILPPPPPSWQSLRSVTHVLAVQVQLSQLGPWTVTSAHPLAVLLI